MRRDGICRVRVFVGNTARVFVLLTDLGDKNTSLSVTDACTIIRDSLLTKKLIPDKCCFMEHYEEIFGGGSTFDLIAFDHRGAPRWTKINQDSAAQLLECDPAEFRIYVHQMRHDVEIGNSKKLFCWGLLVIWMSIMARTSILSVSSLGGEHATILKKAGGAIVMKKSSGILRNLNLGIHG